MHLPTAPRPAGVVRLLAACATAAAVLLVSPAGAGEGPDRPQVVPVSRSSQSSGSADRSDSRGSGSRNSGAQDSDTRNSDTQNSDEQNSGSRDSDARNSDSRDSDARNSDSRNSDSRNSDSQDSDSQDSDARTSDSGTVPPGGKDGKNNGLEVLGRDCSSSKLKPHDGFQDSPTCVSTQMGEVAAEDKLPSLLITDAPRTVRKDQSFALKVSTRNLVRDRFLGAAAGGYYLEASFLNADGLQRGHFHTACRILPSTDEAPDSAGDPQFFLATEDGKGGAEPDTVTIDVPGIEEAGELQCTSWAGDGSHRTPMMTKANETPAIDSVRITVTD